MVAVNVGIVSILQGDESGGNHRAADLDEQAEQDWNYRLPITGGSAAAVLDIFRLFVSKEHSAFSHYSTRTHG